MTRRALASQAPVLHPQPQTTSWHLHPKLNISIFTFQKSSLGGTWGRWGPCSCDTHNVMTAIAGFRNQFAKQEFSNSLWIRLSQALKVKGPKEEGLQEALETKHCGCSSHRDDDEGKASCLQAFLPPSYKIFFNHSIPP